MPSDIMCSYLFTAIETESPAEPQGPADFSGLSTLSFSHENNAV
jgi:hypothetical protein